MFGLTSDTEPLGEDEESTPCRGHPTVLLAMGNPKNKWRFMFAKVIEHIAMFDDTGGQPVFEFVKIDSDWPHD